MTQQHPITPPPELVQQWRAAASNVPATLSTDSGGRHDYIDFIATRAAQWGADQELEACCEYLVRCAQWEPEDVEELRAARRPKPQSLKEQALEQLDGIAAVFRMSHGGNLVCDTIRRALEQLND
jgi:hypothetical protein